MSAQAVPSTSSFYLKHFASTHTEPEAKVYTDEHSGYIGLPNHETIKHSVGQYVTGMAHTNGMESFWALLKRGYQRNLSQDARQAPGPARCRV